MPYKEFIEVYNKKTKQNEIKKNTPKFDDNLFNDDNEAKKNLKELANVICRPININHR
jgi:hypothetical protein